jgi:hypothetical protein
LSWLRQWQSNLSDAARKYGISLPIQSFNGFPFTLAYLFSCCADTKSDIWLVIAASFYNKHAGVFPAERHYFIYSHAQYSGIPFYFIGIAGILNDKLHDR